MTKEHFSSTYTDTRKNFWFLRYIALLKVTNYLHLNYDSSTFNVRIYQLLLSSQFSYASNTCFE